MGRHRKPRLRVSLASATLLAQCLVLPRPAAEARPIDRAEYVRVEHAQLYLLTRGADGAAPVLLWLHGGPGAAERPLFRYFNGALEHRFVVVYWDQRGAGRSFDHTADPRRLTVAQHLRDLDAVVDHLRKVLPRRRIVVVGHSWGAALGLLYADAHPEKVSAIIGVNPLISRRLAEQSEYQFVIDEASRRHDTRTLERVRAMGSPPFERPRDALALEALAQNYGGIFHREPRRFWVMLRAIASGVVRPWEIRRIIQGNNVSLEAMNRELVGLDLGRSVTSLEVPVVFFLGRYDRHVDPRIAADYLASLQAPVKRVRWFENSAHNVPFEEAASFNAAIVSELNVAMVRNRLPRD